MSAHGRHPSRRAIPNARRRPRLEFLVELEELPLARFYCDSAEDQARLVSWLSAPATRARLVDALLDALEEMAA